MRFSGRNHFSTARTQLRHKPKPILARSSRQTRRRLGWGLQKQVQRVLRGLHLEVGQQVVRLAEHESIQQIFRESRADLSNDRIEGRLVFLWPEREDRDRVMDLYPLAQPDGRQHLIDILEHIGLLISPTKTRAISEKLFQRKLVREVEVRDHEIPLATGHPMSPNLVDKVYGVQKLRIDAMYPLETTYEVAARKAVLDGKKELDEEVMHDFWHSLAERFDDATQAETWLTQGLFAHGTILLPQRVRLATYLPRKIRRAMDPIIVLPFFVLPAGRLVESNYFPYHYKMGRQMARLVVRELFPNL